MKTPQGLTGKAKEFYQKIAEKYNLTEAGLELLRVASFTLQRWEEARKILDDSGLILKGKVMRLHPAAKCEHDARLSFSRLMKEMSLDSELEGFNHE